MGYFTKDNGRPPYLICSSVLCAAKKHFQESIKINPQSVNAHVALGLLLVRRLDDFSAAEQHFSEALKINPDNETSHVLLAIITGDKDYESAKYHYLEAIRINPNNATLHYNFASFIKKHMPSDETAKKHYQIALAIDPNLIKWNDI